MFWSLSGAIFFLGNRLPKTRARNGTPEQCWNDQVHKVLLQMLHQALNGVVGQGPILSQRPRDPLSLRPGGAYRTASNLHRGPTPYIYVAALVAQWDAFPQTTLLAAAVRLGYVTKEAAAELIGRNMAAVAAGLNDLAERQALIKKSGVRLHPDQDCSGTGSASSSTAPTPPGGPCLTESDPGCSRITSRITPRMTAHIGKKGRA